MASSIAGELKLQPLPPFKPELYQRAWASVPHPTLPLLATCHSKAVTIYSLSSLSEHSSLTGGHARSVRTAAWKPALPPHKLCLVTASFDSTSAIWRFDGDNVPFSDSQTEPKLEVEITSSSLQQQQQQPPQSSRLNTSDGGGDDASDKAIDDWELILVLEGHESEVKSVAYSPAGQYIATCSRDKSVWIWEDVGATEDEDEWETIAVLNEHDGDVKCLAWCPDVPGRSATRKFSSDVLASCGYDNTIRIWREDGDGEWVCVAVLEGHEGTVWGVQWEADPNRIKFPRLMSFSADKTIRVWTMTEEEEYDCHTNANGRNPMFHAGLGGIPNTMRPSLREDWVCTSTLPAAHTRDVYSATWSASTSLVASTGSDGVIAVYREEPSHGPDKAMSGAADESRTNSQSTSDCWRLLTTLKNAHGPYEVNHIVWCRRYDSACEARGVEEMLITTGDDGLVKPWQIVALT